MRQPVRGTSTSGHNGVAAARQDLFQLSVRTSRRVAVQTAALRGSARSDTETARLRPREHGQRWNSAAGCQRAQPTTMRARVPVALPSTADPQQQASRRSGRGPIGSTRGRRVEQPVHAQCGVQTVSEVQKQLKTRCSTDAAGDGGARARVFDLSSSPKLPGTPESAWTRGRAGTLSSTAIAFKSLALRSPASRLPAILPS